MGGAFGPGAGRGLAARVRGGGGGARASAGGRCWSSRGRPMNSLSPQNPFPEVTGVNSPSPTRFI